MNPRNLLVEFIGTFFLALVIGLVVLSPVAPVVAPGAGPMAALVIGAVLVVIVYAGGHLSGAHYNPAVTLAVFLRGKFPASGVLPYMFVQCLAAVVAGLLVNYIKGGAATPGPEPHTLRVLLIEFLFTYLLISTILNTATSKKNAGNQYYGLAIGFSVLVGAYAGGGISGGVFNPAVACAISVMGLSQWVNIWIFLVPHLLAALAAVAVYKFTNPDEV